jgi:DNA (cytosine-5)-methyltransferase 1
MKHGSLFSGIGGFDLAAEWMGWENVFHCEWNPFGQRILKHYWPNAKSYDDITKTDFTSHRGAIDILTGGFPCQPYSLAGKRKGKADDRHLWPEMLRAIREIQPQWVVGENVFGIVNWNGGMVFDEVQADLEAEGYEVQPYVLPACAVNAPHRRDRVWFVAYRNTEQREYAAERLQSEFVELLTKNPDSNGRPGEQREEEPGIGEQRNAGSGDNERVSANDGEAGVAADTCGPGLKERHVPGKSNGSGYSSGICIAEPPTWNNFPTQPPVRGRNDGLSEYLDGITFSKWRNESIKAYGNAIVPQVALQIFKAIEAYSSFK